MKEITTKDSCIYADYKVLCDVELFKEFKEQIVKLSEDGEYAFVAFYQPDNCSLKNLPVSGIYDFLSRLSLITIFIADDFCKTDQELMFAFDIRLGNGPFTINNLFDYSAFAYDFNARFKHLFGEYEYEKMKGNLNSGIDFTSDMVIIDCECGNDSAVYDSALKYISTLTGGKTSSQLNSILKCYSHVKCGDAPDTEKMSEEELLQFVTQIVHIS